VRVRLDLEAHEVAAIQRSGARSKDRPLPRFERTYLDELYRSAVRISEGLPIARRLELYAALRDLTAGRVHVVAQKGEPDV
jgi:hypothetical protein